MKIDSIDIRSFDAKQLTVDFEPPQTGGDGGDVRRGIDTVGIRNIHTIVRTDSDSPVQRKRQRRGSKTCQ